MAKAKESGDLGLPKMPEIVIEEPKDEKLGDFATTLAMQLARSEKKNPKVIAEMICGFLNAGGDSIESAKVAGPGFINIKMSADFFRSRLKEAILQAVSSVKQTSAKRKKFYWSLSVPIPPALSMSDMAAVPLSGMRCPVS